MTDYLIVLASGSPRRREILERLSVHPAIEPADIDEAPHADEPAAAYVERLAREKAAASARPNTVVIAADTAVIRDGEILGKPESPAHAEALLLMLEGRSHDVMTGVAVSVTNGEGVTVVESAVEHCTVEIRTLSDSRRRWYANSGEPDDKAGGYGLQGAAGLFADSVNGSVSNVIGLPLPLLDELFARHGLDLLSFQTPAPISPVAAIAERALAHITNPPSGTDPVICWASPEDLAASFAETVGIDFADHEPAAADTAIIAAAQQVIDWSVHTNHPRFVNQNYAGADPLAVAGDWLGAALNTAHSTFEIAPVFMLLERALLDKLARLIGYHTDPDRAPGLMCAGGSLAGLHGLQLARARYAPDSVNNGYDGNRVRILVSQSAHYSTEKIAAVLGLGRNAVESVPTEFGGAMDLDALDAALARGPDVMAVVATAGTTVTAAFDPLDGIADRTQERGIWMHVDGSFGASSLLSSTQRWRCRGIERADSVVWNLHKMAGMTQQCSALLVRDPGLIAPTFASAADYLFQADKLYGEYDSGDFNLQCGRRVDVLKAWLTWKSIGDEGMADRIDHAVALADHVRQRIEGREDLASIVAGDFVTSCLTWVPPKLRPFDLFNLDETSHAQVHALAPAAKARMQADGSALIGFQPVHGINCFRLIFMNPAVSFDDADVLLDLIAEHSAAAWAQR